jgi:hypothetical protein
MTYTEPRYGSSYTKKISQSNPEDLLRTIRDEIGGNRKKEKAAFRDAVLNDPAMVDVCIEWVWVNAGRNLDRIAVEPLPPIEAVRAQRETQQTAITQEIVPLIKTVRRNILVDAVRHLTFGQLAAIATNKNTAKLARMGKKDEVIGDKFDDATIEKVLKG